MTRSELDDLSDSELAARLRHRGVSTPDADHLVANRDDVGAVQAILTVLR